MDGLKYAYLGHDYAEHVRERLRKAPSALSEVWYRRFADGILRRVDLGDSPHDAAMLAIAKEVS